MRLLDRFRRPDRVRASKQEKSEEKARPLPEKIEPPAAARGAAAQESLSNRASEEDAA